MGDDMKEEAITGAGTKEEAIKERVLHKKP